jgi:ATP-dependent Lon protease
MPKNSSEYLTSHYGFITDYLAEAFHYQFKHTNRYEEVSRQIRLGKDIEGRDEKGIKKTVAAFLKILHPGGPATAEELEDYVAYATECRRRVKEQMNKRKPDDEFARINLSYFDANGQEIVVFCPESKDALATQQPARRRLKNYEVTTETAAHAAHANIDEVKLSNADDFQPIAEPAQGPSEPGLSQPKEQHFTILYGDIGHSYETIMSPYLRGSKEVTIEDPYIRLQHQIQNFVRFCEACLKSGSIKTINLVCSYDDRTELADISEKLDDLKQSLLESDIVLNVSLNPNMHDREIRLDNG